MHGSGPPDFRWYYNCLRVLERGVGSNPTLSCLLLLSLPLSIIFNNGWLVTGYLFLVGQDGALCRKNVTTHINAGNSVGCRRLQSKKPCKSAM